MTTVTVQQDLQPRIYFGNKPKPNLSPTCNPEPNSNLKSKPSTNLKPAP